MVTTMRSSASSLAEIQDCFGHPKRRARTGRAWLRQTLKETSELKAEYKLQKPGPRRSRRGKGTPQGSGFPLKFVERRARLIDRLKGRR
jgi:hypothetical protein